MNNLLFRRQYFITQHNVAEFSHWNKLHINKELSVYAHPDLEFEQYTNEDNNIILLGFLVDPYNINHLNYDIIKDICKKSRNFEDVLDYTYDLTGRWVIIFDNGRETKVVNDLIGLREIYYTFDNSELWVGTDPEILNHLIGLEKNTDPLLNEYISSPYFKNTENAFYGNKTLYKNTFHLLPNHYLDLKNGTVSRYWINKEEQLDLEEATQISSDILKSSLKGANKRYSLIQAVTAGLDSRVLLAASKDISEDIFYFVSQENMDENHMDLKIPSKLLSKLNLELNIIKDVAPLRNEFEQLLLRNISLFRTGHHRNTTTQYYHDYLEDKVSVNGIISEIGRNRFGVNHPSDDNIDSEYLMKLVSCPLKYKYVSNELSDWIRETRTFSKQTGFGLVNLFYWEQFMGNWGTLTRNEEDIAVEGFMPFSNRKLIMTLTSVEDKYRVAPDNILYINIIKNMWAETLSEPINPESKLKLFLKSIIPKEIRRMIRNTFQ